MKYNELYASAFRYGLMFGKDIVPGAPVSISVLDEKDVLLAVKKAYIDMSPRTLKKEGGGNEQVLDTEMKEKLFVSLAKKIADYMNKGTNDFDDWHDKLCVFFIDEFAKILKKANRQPKDATYGKAQKIVNMTFKYLYCYDDANQYFDRFVPCHMVLDSYILNWFSSWYLDEYNKDKKRGEKLTKSGKYQLPKWSHLKYQKEHGKDIIPQYKEIQEEIRKRLDKSKPKIPPIEKEFIIWYEERKKIL